MESLSIHFQDHINKITSEKKWTNKSRIIGEAMEDCAIMIPCPLCQSHSLVKYDVNQKSKDVHCTSCLAQIQIKAAKYTKKKQTVLTLLGAEYSTTRASIQENDVHYLVFLYTTDNTIHDILFINRDNITDTCIIPRKPLSATAKRAGWQGCVLRFDTFVSLKQQCSLK
jgi:type II restriction enzyme